MKLLIISHTEHYRCDDGQIAGWGPTIREINHLINVFDEVYHVAPLHQGTVPGSSMCYESNRIHFIPLIPSGGHTLAAKVRTLYHAPATIRTVMKTLKKADVFQFRAPTGIGVYLLPWLTVFSSKPGWIKYAGNWPQEAPPKGYAFQRWWLTRNLMRCPVTINGHWPAQPKHCLTFENPCLDEGERTAGKRIIENKDYTGPLEFCFIGRLEDAKGVRYILNSLQRMADLQRVNVVHFIGDGPLRAEYEQMASEIPCDIRFHGFLRRDELVQYLKRSHLFLLPSESEGFPKVVAEAANYGCIPVVSRVGSIGQYVNNENGWVLDGGQGNECESLVRVLSQILSNGVPEVKARLAYELAEPFTFSKYTSRVITEICKR